MRILMVSAAILPFWKCGVATVVHDLCVQMQQAGDEIGLFALDILEKKDQYLILEGNPCWITGAPLTDDRMFVSDSDKKVRHVNERFQACLKEFKPDVVHFHTPQYFSLTLIRLAKEMGARTVITLHDSWWICPKQFYAPEPGKKCPSPSREACLACMAQEDEADYTAREDAIAKAEKQMDCFVCVSSILYREIVQIKPHLKEKTVVISNPVKERVNVLSEIEGPLTFAFLGGQSIIKGYPVVLDAFRKLPATPEWQLNIYGCTMQKGENAAQTKKSMLVKLRNNILHPMKLLRKLCAIIKGTWIERTQEKYIHHRPPFSEDERREILAQTHVVIVCSQVQESFSLVAYEAMSNGCCVISTPCGGPTAIVKNGENGIVLEDFTAKSLRKAAWEMVNRRELVERYRKNAHELSKTFCNQIDVSRQYRAVYRG